MQSIHLKSLLPSSFQLFPPYQSRAYPAGQHNNSYHNMARKFFVGGNFKMNPISREEKRTLVKTLNDADVDQSVGLY